MCPDCKEATEHPSHRQYCPKCIFCGARLIKRIGAIFNGDRAMQQARMRQVLADWVAIGHSEAEIRRLVKEGPLHEPLPVVEEKPKSKKGKK
jgi:hypothetical protein